jgi:hypothetical protein
MEGVVRRSGLSSNKIMALLMEQVKKALLRAPVVVNSIAKFMS